MVLGEDCGLNLEVLDTGLRRYDGVDLREV